MGENRLVTLTGSGGAGKTRLAIQVGLDLCAGFPNGAWFVDLTPLADPALLSGTILAALGVRSGGGDLAEMEMRGSGGERITLNQFLERKTLLLILDNCEHLVEACTRLADELLRLCPGLKLLATSREALSVPGEKTYHVASLSLPEAQQLVNLDALIQSDAVRLFIERAQSADGRFALTEGNATAVVQICRRLDGIPLAIELGAARVKVMSAEQIAGRMDDFFRLLTAGSRTSLPRHQTLRAAIEWSYNLLSEAEKAVFRRLAVFRGGWSLEAAEAVCAGEDFEPFDALDLLGRLVEKSLVIKEEQGGQARYRMLEMIRQYTERQLYASEDEVEEAHNRHLDWFLALAETAAPLLRTAEQIAWLERLELEHDNLRAALGWALEGKHGEEALRLVGALFYFWQIHNHEREGKDWMKRTLDLAEADLALRQLSLWARAVAGNEELTLGFGNDTTSLRSSLEDALEIFRRENDLSGEGQALRLLALTLLPYLPEFTGVYLVEEPENGIHPRAIETMFQSLSSVYGAQILLATHSPVILSIVKADDVLCFAKTEDGATDIVVGSKHPALREWRGETNLGVLFAAGVLG